MKKTAKTVVMLVIGVIAYVAVGRELIVRYATKPAAAAPQTGAMESGVALIVSHR